jgi:hypothetical protein
MAWNDAPASANAVMSQLEASRLLNSDAIVECVASTKDPSALLMKTPIINTAITFMMGLLDDGVLPPLSTSRPLASEESSSGPRYHGINALSESELSRLEVVRELSLDEDVDWKDQFRGRKVGRSWVRSVGGLLLEA